MISKDKTYRTRDGREVRIYATDGDKWSPIHGAIKEKSGWCFCVWHEDGSYIDSMLKQSNDLIEVKPRIKRTVWLNVFGDHVYGAYTKEGVDIHPYVDSRLACVKVEIDCEEGEGL
jgi:hypothetical protein